MKAKILVTLALVVSLATVPAQPPANPAPAKANVTLVECVVVMVVVGVGATIVVGIYKMCHRKPSPGSISNRLWLSNLQASALSPQAIGDSASISLQSAPEVSAQWTEEFSFGFSQDGTNLTAIAYRNGQPVLTNSAAITVQPDGDGAATVDFSALSAISTNLPAGQFFRLAQ